MEYPLLLTAVVALMVTMYFVGQGLVSFGGSTDDKTFFLMKGTVLGRDAAASHAAANMSLATVFFFFITFGEAYGLALIIAPITLCAGAYLFARIILPRLEAQHFFGAHRPSTLAEYVETRTGSRALSTVILYATLVGMLSVVLIELFLGVQIFSIFLKESDPEAFFQTEDASLVLIMCAVFVYTAFGGLQAVLKTDRAQFRLMIVAVLSLLLWLLFIGLTATPSTVTLETFRPMAMPMKQGFGLPYPLLANMVVVNVLFTTCMLRTWMVTAAQPDVGEARRGVLGGAWNTAVIAGLLMVVGILVFRTKFEGHDPGMVTLMLGLADLPRVAGEQDLLSILGAYAVLPLLFAACLAALLSSVDSALLPALQSFFTDFHRKGRRASDSDSIRKFWQIPVATLGLMMAALILYFFVFRYLRYDLYSWLFTIFGFSIAAGPVLAFIVVAPREWVRRKPFVILGCVAVIGSVVITATLSYWGNHTENVDLVMYGSPVAVAFGAVLMVAAAIGPLSRPAKYKAEVH